MNYGLQVKEDRAKLVQEFSSAAKRLFIHPLGLDIQNINELSLDVLTLALNYPAGANYLFGGPDGLSLDMNKVPAKNLELIFQYSAEARRLSNRPDFNADIAISISFEKLSICLKYQKQVSELFYSPSRGLDIALINQLSLEDLQSKIRNYVPDPR